MEKMSNAAANTDIQYQDDEYWIKRMSTDTTAFEVIYDRYVDRVSRYISRKVGNPSETEELTSIVFVSVLEAIMGGKYSAQNKFAAWLFTIARTKITNYYRERKTLPLDDVADTPTNCIAELEDFEDYELENRFSQLTNFEQDLLALRFSADLDFKTIAIILHKKAAAVKMATYRALNKLRKSMEE